MFQFILVNCATFIDFFPCLLKLVQKNFNEYIKKSRILCKCDERRVLVYIDTIIHQRERDPGWIHGSYSHLNKLFKKQTFTLEMNKSNFNKQLNASVICIILDKKVQRRICCQKWTEWNKCPLGTSLKIEFILFTLLIFKYSPASRFILSLPYFC